MIKDNELFELEHRYCPICGEEIKIGESLHYCDEKKLKEIRKEERQREKEIKKQQKRTYGDRLEEYEEHYNPENYKEEDIEDV